MNLLMNSTEREVFYRVDVTTRLQFICSKLVVPYIFPNHIGVYFPQKFLKLILVVQFVQIGVVTSG